MSINNLIIIRGTNGKILVISTFIDHIIFLSLANSVANDHISIEVI